MSKVLVVDDKELMRDSVATTLSRRGHAVAVAADAQAALHRIAERSPDAVITDLQMPGMTGLELLGEIRRLDEQLPVILMTAFGTVETAVSAMKQGAFDYVTKPFSGDELAIAVDRAVEHGRLLRENQILRADAPAASQGDAVVRTMVGEGRVMAVLKERLNRIADSHGTVLICGESGTGKEIAARFIHARSPRAAAPFLAINCAALSTSLLESELFGHEKGAFTGADKLRKGRFELADGGTLLLDEISEVGPEIQAKLLRVLQERCFERVGSSASRAVDVRVIATTNRDLRREVDAGRFREDLLFRLNVLPVNMPPLRERMEDAPALVQHFLGAVAAREGKPVKSLSPEAADRLARYRWPGNVRELQNICERAAVLTAGPVIEAALIEPWLNDPDLPCDTGSGSFRADGERLLDPDADGSIPNDLVCDGTVTLEDIEREAILATLRRHNGHRQRSAAALGIGVRTLGLKLKKWKEAAIVAPTV
ncbi:MAG: sigma-54-dependent Fis family transcriptional regulator [Phycisphaerales bacterium]|nr:sigma-54-dependent Fis family transcriptional regulator [Phycisphaerales bacterium]